MFPSAAISLTLTYSNPLYHRGLWKEVDTKKALEKTAQALRDGAFPLRKQLSEDFSDSGLLEAVFDTKDGRALNLDSIVGDIFNEPENTATTPHPLKNSQKGHRRRVSAPVVQKLPEFTIDELPDPKRSRPNSPNMTSKLTGINFPSPDALERGFLMGTHVNDATRAVKKHHRRLRTFGGYSCSDYVSDMNVEDIFAMFLGTSNPQQTTQNILSDEAALVQADAEQNVGGTDYGHHALNSGNDNGSVKDDIQSIAIPNHPEEITRKQSLINKEAHLAQLFSESSPIVSSPSPNQDDITLCSPQTYPSPQLQGNIEIPLLVGQPQPELNLMTIYHRYSRRLFRVE